MTETKLNMSGLQELFGRALLTKLTTQRSFRPGKHYRTRGAGGQRWPSGWKLIRKWYHDGRIFRGIERNTGEGALLRIPQLGDKDAGKVVAQYNRFDHEKSHGWHVVDPFNWIVYGA